MATSWSPQEKDSPSPRSPSASLPPIIGTPELHEDPIFDSPPQNTTPMTPQNLFLSAPLNHMTPQSLPGTPQLSQRSASGGKIREGFKRMFRPPSAQTSFDRNSHPLSSTEDNNRQSDGSAVLSKNKRYQKLRIRKTLKRRKRRSEKGQYSDDGYTSDPGPPMPDDSLPPGVDMVTKPLPLHNLTHEELDEDEETDGADSSEGHGGQGAESRVNRQKKEIQKKLERMKTQLEQEKEHFHETQTSYLQDLESTTSEKAQQRIKNRFQRDHLKSHTAIEQNLKKIDKYQKDMAHLQEGGTKEGLRGKIEGGLKAPLVGIRKGFNMAGNTLKKSRRYIIRTRSSQGDVVDEEGKISVELIPEEEEGEDGSEALVLEEEEEGDVVSKRTIEELQKHNESLKIELEEQERRVTTMEEIVSEMLSKVDQFKDTYERLQEQVDDVMDLHQNAVGELRGQLSQVESATLGKTQDLEDIMQENQGKVDKLDALVHREIERKAEMETARNWLMTIGAPLVTFVLHLVAFSLRLSSLLSTGKGALLAVAVAIIGILLLWTLIHSN